MSRLRVLVSELFRAVPVDESYGEVEDLLEYVAELIGTWTGGVDEDVADEVFGGFLPGWSALDRAQRGSWLVRMLSAAGSDGIDAAAEAGITAVIQPGGSMRDEEVIAAADEAGMAMVFTGMRHFRH